MTDWFNQLNTGDDVEDTGDTYSSSDAHHYQRGGTLGINTERDSDDKFWFNDHIQRNANGGRDDTNSSN